MELFCGGIALLSMNCPSGIEPPLQGSSDLSTEPNAMRWAGAESPLWGLHAGSNRV